MGKNRQLIASMQFIVLILSFAMFPNSACSQTDTNSNNKEPLNIGIVLYTKSYTPGTLFAISNYANTSTSGIASGGPKTAGFVGNYHVRYFRENGEALGEYALIIEKTGDFYDVSWLTNGEVAAKGVGMEVQNGLAVAWRRVSD